MLDVNSTIIQQLTKQVIPLYVRKKFESFLIRFIETKNELTYQLFRNGSALFLGIFVQFILALQFQWLISVNLNLLVWFEDAWCGMLKILYSEHLLLLYLSLFCYGLLISKFYLKGPQQSLTRYEFLINNAYDKILLLGMQLIYGFVSLHAFINYLPDIYKNEPRIVTYMQLTTVSISAYTFCSVYMKREFELHFDLVHMDDYVSKVVIILQQAMASSVGSNFLKLTFHCFLLRIMLYAVFKNAQFQDSINYIFHLSLILSIAQSTMLSIERLIHLMLTMPLDFTTLEDVKKPSLLKCLSRRGYSAWIFLMAIRNALNWSLDSRQYKETEESMLNHICDISLQIINDFNVELNIKLESPSELIDKVFTEQALKDSKKQHIFKRSLDKTAFVRSLIRAPTFCSCAFGPCGGENGAGIKIRFPYFLWHFFHCPLYGSKVRHCLKYAETMSFLVRALANVCTNGLKTRKSTFIKNKLSAVIRTFIGLLDCMETVSFVEHELYGLDARAFEEWSSLKSSVKFSLFQILLCYNDMLSLFVDKECLRKISQIAEFYKLPLSTGFN